MHAPGTKVLVRGNSAVVERDVGGGDFIVRLTSGPNAGERRAVNARDLVTITDAPAPALPIRTASAESPEAFQKDPATTDVPPPAPSDPAGQVPPVDPEDTQVITRPTEGGDT